jgi:hypothetical protein
MPITGGGPASTFAAAATGALSAGGAGAFLQLAVSASVRNEQIPSQPRYFTMQPAYRDRWRDSTPNSPRRSGALVV